MMISIWVDPSDHQNILAGGHHGGLWKTTNGGDAWFPLHDLDSRLHGVNSIAVDPLDHDVIYISGTNTLSFVSSYSAGVFKSSDAGDTWELLNNFEGVNYPSGNLNEESRKLFYHPRNPDTLFFLNARALFMSTDGGDHWEQLFHKNYVWYDGSGSGSFFNHSGMFDIAISTSFESVVYLAGSEVFQIHLKPASASDSINISEEVFQAGMSPNDILIRPPFRCGISVDDHFPGMVWFCYVADYYLNGTDSVSLFRIVKYSEVDSTFSFIYQGPNGQAPNLSASKLIFTVSPGNDSVFYIGGTYITELQIQPGLDTLFRIGGAAYPDSTFIHDDMRAMQMFSDANGHDTMYMANDGGVAWGTPYPEEQRPANNYWQWHQTCGGSANGLEVTEFYGFGLSDSEPDLLAGGCQDLSDMLFSDGCWANFSGGDGGEVVFDPADPNIFYFFEFQYGYYYRTNDGGIHDESFYGPVFPVNYVMAPMILDAFDQSTLYGASLGNLMKFTGVNHFPDAPGVDTLFNFTDSISDIEVVDRGNNNRRFYVSTVKAYHSYSDPPPVVDSLVGCIFRSDYNNASSFSDISKGLEGCIDGFVCDMEIDPNDYDRLWVACALFSEQPDSLEKVFYSEDGGIHWQKYSDGLPEGMPVYKIKYVPSINTLFAATDVGIFKRIIGSDHWVSFNHDLPRKIITDLETNVPYNKIIASTYGRGMWESSLDCPSNDSTLIISSSTTWDEDLFLDREVFIDSGFVLTIKNCTVSLPSYKKIIVSRGARLYVDSAILTTYCRIPWGGIEAWGNPRFSQLEEEHFGCVEITNGSVIENAMTGLRTGRTDPYDHFFEEYNGGIVRILSSTFQNNQTAVEFLPFYNFHPVYQHELRYCGNIYNSEFITDKDILDSRPFEEFVKMTQVNGIDIRGCSFSNQRALKIDYSDRGKGIYSLGAQFYVDDFCLNPNISPCEELKSCTFFGLEYGIKDLNEGHNYTCSIKNAKFNKNRSGIYLSVCNYATITRNSFQINTLDNSRGDTIYGLYLDHCTGYQVEENVLIGSSTPNQWQPAIIEIGMVINNSGTLENEIYNNTFDSLFVGILAQDQNRSEDGRLGLQIKCNDFTNSKYDISVEKSDLWAMYMGIKEHQGSQGDAPTDPANNTFGWVNLHYSDYYNACENILYWHLDTTLTSAHIKPRYYSQNVNPQHDVLNNNQFVKDTCCPSHLDTTGGGHSIGEEKINMSLASQQADSAQNMLAELVDGGATEELTMEIQNSTPEDAIELFDQLLENSPYLSDSSMIAAIQKEDVLSGAILTNVLSENPQSAKSDTVQQTLNNRTDPLTDEQRILIDQGWFTIGAKESLVSQYSRYKSKQYSAFNCIIRQFKHDTLLTSATDSIIMTLMNEDLLEYKYLLAFECLGKKDTTDAIDVLHAISDDYALSSKQEQQHFAYEDYIEWLIGLYSQNKTIYEVDSIEKSELLNLLPNSSGELKMMVINMLQFIGTFKYREPILLPDDGLKSEKVKMPKAVKPQDNSWFNIYPNPGTNTCILEYSLNKNEDNVVVQMTDVNGKLIKKIDLVRNNDLILVNLTDLPVGLYFFQVTGGNRILGVRKLVKF